MTQISSQQTSTAIARDTESLPWHVQIAFPPSKSKFLHLQSLASPNKYPFVLLPFKSTFLSYTLLVSICRRTTSILSSPPSQYIQPQTCNSQLSSFCPLWLLPSLLPLLCQIALMVCFSRRRISLRCSQCPPNSQISATSGRPTKISS